MGGKSPSPHVMISARDLKDIARDVLYGLQAKLRHSKRDNDFLPDEWVKAAAKEIVQRALLSPR